MNLVLTCYFNSISDPQRGKNLEANIYNIESLVNSLGSQKVVVLTDCLTKKPKEWSHVSLVKTKINYNPYFARWRAFLDYLLEHPEIKKVFIVDSTDVEMLRNPFNNMVSDKIYVGDEEDNLNSEWINSNHKYIASALNPNLPLLNIGLLGANYEMIVDLLNDFLLLYKLYEEMSGLTEMALFNLLLHTKYKDNIIHGRTVNTHFNKYSSNDISWWQHK